MKQWILDTISKYQNLKEVPVDKEEETGPAKSTLVNIIKSSTVPFKGGKQAIRWYRPDDFSKGSLLVHNSYFNSTCDQVYDIDKNESIISYHVNGKTPKYLKKVVNEVGFIVRGMSVNPNDPWDGYTLDLYDNPRLTVESQMWTVGYKTVFDGPMFLDHYQCLQEIKQLQHLYRSFREKVKTKGVEELLENIDPSEGREKQIKLNKNYLI